MHANMLLDYDLLEAGKEARAVAEAWGRVWHVVPMLAKRWHVLSVRSFDEKFQGIQSLRDWANDYDLFLSNAAQFEPSFKKVRLSFAREFSRTFPRDLYDVLRMRIEPDGKLFSEYDEMQRRYESVDHVVPYVGTQPASKAPAPTKVGRNDPCPCGSGKKTRSAAAGAAPR